MASIKLSKNEIFDAISQYIERQYPVAVTMTTIHIEYSRIQTRIGTTAEITMKG